MTNAEFIQATTRLENYYGKEYTTEQLKIMFDFLRGWTVEKYMKAINFCLKNNIQKRTKMSKKPTRKEHYKGWIKLLIFLES